MLGNFTSTELIGLLLTELRVIALDGIKANLIVLGGKARGESGPFGGGQRAIGDSFYGRVDIDIHFCRHEHDLFAAASLRALL